jgi:DedD protein
MATTASTEASEIRRRGRRRLIGAIVLVVLAVVFVPMILDSEPKPRQGQLSLDIPPKDTAPPLPPPTKVAATPAKQEAVIPPPKTQAAPPETAPAKQEAKAEAPAPKAETKAEAPRLEGFAVQVGAFKDEEKLAQARQKLAAARIPHFVERRGDLNRLRAGPYSTREAAEKALASIKAASLNGQVVPLP